MYSEIRACISYLNSMLHATGSDLCGKSKPESKLYCTLCVFIFSRGRIFRYCDAARNVIKVCMGSDFYEPIA